MLARALLTVFKKYFRRETRDIILYTSGRRRSVSLGARVRASIRIGYCFVFTMGPVHRLGDLPGLGSFLNIFPTSNSSRVSDRARARAIAVKAAVVNCFALLSPFRRRRRLPRSTRRQL